MHPLIIIIAILAIALLIYISVLERPKALVGDPLFNKPLKENSDFSEPCYVYSDESESLEIKKNLAIIGYRISPTLVIHDISGKKSTDDFEKAVTFAKDHNGRFLTSSDVNTLKANYAKLNALRLKIGEPRIPQGYFWIDGKNRETIADFAQNDSYFQAFFNINNPCIILKR